MSLRPPPIPLVYNTANLIGVDDFVIDLAILQTYYVLTLESLAYLNYYLFSNHGNYSQMKSLFTTLDDSTSGFFRLNSASFIFP